MAANAQSVVELVFQGIDKTSEATRAALENLGRVSGGVKDVTQPIADFTVGAAKLEAGLLAAGIALTTFAVYKASEFEGAVLDLQKVLSESDGPISQFTEASRELGNEFGISSTEVLQSVANFKQAGFDAQEALQLVRNALDLKIAGDLEAAQSSELLVASLKGFQLEASEAGRIVDLLNAVSNEYATDVEQLAEGFAKLSPVAKAAGLSLEEAAGLLTPGIEVFRSGSEVANGLRTVLLRLQDDSKPVGEALDALGVSQYNANGQLRTARDIYFDVAAAFGKLDDSQKTYYAAQLAGMDQSAKFLAVVDGLGKTLQISGKDFEYLGSAAKEVEIRLASAEVQASRAQVAFENMLVDIGTPLLDEFGGIAGAITNIFQAVGASVRQGQLGGLVAYVESIMDDIQATLQRVAQNLPEALEKADLGRFRDGIDAIVRAFGLLFDEIDLTTVDGLVKAINVAGTAFLGLSRYVAGVIESFKPLFDQLVAVGSGLEDFDTGILQALGNIGGFVTQANLLATGLNGLLPYLETLLGLLLVKQAGGLVGAFKGLVGVLPALTTGPLGVAGLAAAFGLAGYNVGTALVPHIDDLVSRLTGSKTTLGGWVYDLVHGSEAAEELGGAVKQAGAGVESANAAAQKAGVAWGGATGAWEEGGNALTELGKSAKGLANPFEEANNKMLANLTASEKAAAASKDLAGAQADVSKNTGKVVPIIDALTGAVIGFEQNMTAGARGLTELGKSSSTATDALTKSKTQAEQAAKAAREYALELEKLASNERIKLIEAKVQLNVAQVEADTRRIEAVIDSLNVGIESTGTLLGGLFDNLTDLASKPATTAQRLIEEQIQQENELRLQEFELQKELTQAQIENLRAQAKALSNGDALIKVDGAGLQPHLEAFMWEILRAVQVRVNQDGLELLVGA